MAKHPTVERLAEVLRDDYADDLRAVLYYDSGGYDPVYVRDDLTDEYAEREIEGLLDEIGIETVERRSKEETFEHGNLLCTLKVFEEAVECYLFAGSESGIAISLAPIALGDIRSVLVEWRDVAGLDTIE